MKEELLKICSASVDPHIGCDKKKCIYNIQYYNGELTNWLIVHRGKITDIGICLKEMEGKYGRGYDAE